MTRTSLPRAGTIGRAADWGRLLVGFLLVFGLFQWAATALGSDRGQAGLVVAAIVLASLVLTEIVLFRRRGWGIAAGLGLGMPQFRGVAVAAAVSALLLLVIPSFALATGSAIRWTPDAASVLPGLFAQAGLAEETLFRGYLYGQLRVGRSFWRAATLSMLPFVAVHLLMFVTMPWPIAAASMLLAVVTSFPLARLYDLGGATIWAPAILHFVIQGAVKVIVWFGGNVDPMTFPIVWIAASALIPMVVMAFPARDSQ